MEVEFSTFCTAYDYGKILIVNNERIIERLNSKYSNGCASNGNIILETSPRGHGGRRRQKRDRLWTQSSQSVILDSRQ